jgi:hypothetical protein
MENFLKRRGRPRKIPESLRASFGLKSPEIPDAAREMVVGALRTDRTRANAYYADNAREVVEGLSKQVEMPENPMLAAKLRLGMDWILARRTVLTELGRMMDGDPDRDPTEEDVARFQAVVRHIASRHDKLTAMAACAHIRGRRMGETKRRDRVTSLHHDLNAAINLHRQRFPESSWTDIREALELTVGQVERKHS